MSGGVIVSSGSLGGTVGLTMLVPEPLFVTVLFPDVLLTVLDENRYVLAAEKDDSFPYASDLGIQVDDNDGTLKRVISEGVTCSNTVPKEVFGFSIQGNLQPIKDGNKVVGVLIYSFSLEEQEEIVENMNGMLSELSSSNLLMDELVGQAEILQKNLLEINEISTKAEQNIAEALKVVSSIQNNAKYSNILALNASIESARAGQAGKGFAVVSDEMRKFSEKSGEAAKNISATLSEMFTSLQNIQKAIEASTNISKEQASSAKRVNKVYTQVTETAKKVDKLVASKL